MINQSIEFECLTPCFCAGAEQSHAEIRPSAIRGALRWWFRCLGGSLDQEETVFGGANSLKASAIQVRVSAVEPITFKVPNPAPKPMTPLAYILYFASIAGNADGKAQFGTGARWNASGALGAGTNFTLNLRQLRQLPDGCEKLLKSAIEAFKHYGAIGLRITRGFGAVQAQQVTPESFNKIDDLLHTCGFILKKGSRAHQDWEKWMKHAGEVLKNDLRDEFGAGGNKKPAKASALGSINPVRQTSAVYLRPIKVNGKLIFAAFEAPHSKVLGDKSKQAHSEAILKDRQFS